MRFYKLSCFVFSFVLVLGGTAMAVDSVDIGLVSSETGHNLVSWGPVEPSTHGGSFGGIDHCRAIWTNFDTPIPASNDAYIDMSFAGGPELVSFKHLDGPADDSFEVWMGGNVVFTYLDIGLSGERWYVSGFNYTPPSAGVYTVRFEATGQAWSSWGTYGQVCIAGIWVGPGGPVASEMSSWGNVKSLFR
ncbi:MAG: hypothetical protein KAH56_05200 [Candidatus Krumholzibacteria bacterium]|nr:hypothetical protein [Candidatus Krumholzibacteria bacterium]